MFWSGIGRGLRTLKHVERGQLAWRAVHEMRLRGYRLADALLSTETKERFFPLAWEDAATLAVDRPLAMPTLRLESAASANLYHEGRVLYLGMAGDRDNWRAGQQSRLWRYEHQYHAEVLAMAAMEAAECQKNWIPEVRHLVTTWARDCPVPFGDAWEPYPVARRVLNWSAALAICPALAADLTGYLATQIRFLSQRIEHHLLGNHVLCDAAALVAGTAVIDAPGLAPLWAQAAGLLTQQLDAQVLADGGYAERTMQYHGIVLRDALWALLLSRQRGLDLAIDGILVRMLTWFARVGGPRQIVRRINDASPDATPSLASLRELAAAAGVKEPGQRKRRPSSRSSAVVDLPDTGWTIISEGDHELLFDTGPVGPPEQPGHGHNDTLQYELVWDGKAVVTDTGVSLYESGTRRTFERSAPAHATVSVAGEGGDELWAAFRVAGRAAPGAGQWMRLRGGFSLAGRNRGHTGWQHDRRLTFLPGQALLVEDRVSGTQATDAIVSHIPLAPGLSLSSATTGDSAGGSGPGWRLVRPQLNLDLRILRGQGTSIETGWACSGFGRSLPRSTLAVAADSTGCAAYLISKAGLRVHWDGRKLRLESRGQSILNSVISP